LISKHQNTTARRIGMYFLMPVILLPGLIYPQETPDFGPDGLAGLTLKQREKLARGEIIRTESTVTTPEGKTLIEAALVFNQPPEEVWRLLSKTEDQVKYLDEVKSVSVVCQDLTGDTLELTIKVLVKTIVYRQVHRFDEKNLFFEWSLDPDFRCDLKELQGFWKFYPFGSGSTLARYGSRVSFRFLIPRFIQTALIKNNLPRALRSVRKYVNSGGTWEKNRRSPS
jgi:hypothetical protein